MKIRPAGAELFHGDRRMDGRDEANSRFSQFCESAPPKKRKYCPIQCSPTSEKKQCFLEGSQASAVCPSGKGKTRMNTEH